MTTSKRQADEILRTVKSPPADDEPSTRRARPSVAGKHDGGGSEGEVWVPSKDASALQAAALTGDRMPRSRRAWNDQPEDDE